jgi:hypothetical protein
VSFFLNIKALLSSSLTFYLQLDLGLWLSIPCYCSVLGKEYRHRNGAECQLERYGTWCLLVSIACVRWLRNVDTHRIRFKAPLYEEHLSWLSFYELLASFRLSQQSPGYSQDVLRGAKGVFPDLV